MFKILLVDDDADVRRYVKKVLERDNHHVVVVDNGLSALNELNNDTYDLLLSDANMPQYSGFDLIRTIRLQAKHTDLIIAMLTGRREKQDIQQAIELGVKDYIVKPIDAQLLTQKVQKILENKIVNPAVINMDSMVNVDWAASAQSPLKMRTIGIAGFSAHSSVAIPVGFEFYLHTDQLSSIQKPKAVVTGCQFSTVHQKFVIEGNFLEMDDLLRQQIKNCLKKYGAAA
jgi:CheY-like chemotaxis protein